MEKHGVVNLIDDFVSCDETGISKPDPDVFLRCLNRLGCSNVADEKDNIIIFEDSIAGLTAANATGSNNVVCITHEDINNISKLNLSKW